MEILLLLIKKGDKKMKLKKFALLMIAVLVGICLVSCGNGSDTTDEDPTMYKITYVLDGGTLPANAVQEYDDSKGVVLPIPSKAGASFEGWYMEEDFSGAKVNKISPKYGKDVTVYAKWNAAAGNVFNITYHLNDGEFEGWGTSLCWWANRICYSDSLSSKAAELFYGDSGLRMNIARYNIGGGDDPSHDHITRTDSNMPGYTVYNNGKATYDWSKDANAVDGRKRQRLFHA